MIFIGLSETVNLKYKEEWKWKKKLYMFPQSLVGIV